MELLFTCSNQRSKLLNILSQWNLDRLLMRAILNQQNHETLGLEIMKFSIFDQKTRLAQSLVNPFENLFQRSMSPQVPINIFLRITAQENSTSFPKRRRFWICPPIRFETLVLQTIIPKCCKRHLMERWKTETHI